MTVAPTWSILIPTLGERAALFERLMTGLMPQVEAAAGRVHVIGWWNNGSPSLPKIRQTMIQHAATDYVSFVDDDDMVSPDFVAEVLAALDQGSPDYVGFQVQCYSDGHPTAIAHHSLEYTRWRNLPGRFERDISHLNPMRTVIARSADFTRARPGAAEDRIWAEQLRRSRRLTSQVFIPRVLYHYLYSTGTHPGQGSRWQKHQTIHRPSADRPEVTSPHFTWSPHA